ncbi:MAG: ribosomal L7Ae/L30e/S12e/Gadd45 family protein, partial [Lachnospiraceae bacterium]|nr:ribosomal L7Ae/L30e/S12e/Gadd45 family protein [Lachnospiraceae bacterium]
MANNDKVLSMIGLCMKAGKLKSGEFAVEETVKNGQARLVIVASDASENTKKSYAD